MVVVDDDDGVDGGRVVVEMGSAVDGLDVLG